MHTTTARRLLALLMLLAMTATACAGEEGEDSADVGGDAASEAATDEATDAEAAATDPSVDATSSEAPAGEDAGESAGEPLTLAYLLPETGALAFLGPQIIAAHQLALADINAAGGTNGAEVVGLSGDEGDGDGTIANASVDRLLAEGVQGIVGAASSGISLSVIDKVTGAGVAMCSPSNTSPTFTSYNDGGLYFRAAPTDALQGPVLAEQIVAAGGSNVAILARADDYGQGLLDATQASLEEAGATVAVATTYDPMAQSFDAEVQTVVDAGADAVAVIAFDEGARILSTMVERGVGPADVIVFGGDGLNSSDLPGFVAPDDPSILEGMGVTAPAASTNEGFITALREFDPALEDFGFSPEAYDCTIAMALAAVAGGANTSEAIAANLNAVTVEGTECTSFEACAELLASGEDIDYQGVSGPMDFTDAGEPSVGRYEVKQFDADGNLNVVDTITSSLPE